MHIFDLTNDNSGMVAGPQGLGVSRNSPIILTAGAFLTGNRLAMAFSYTSYGSNFIYIYRIDGAIATKAYNPIDTIYIPYSYAPFSSYANNRISSMLYDSMRNWLFVSCPDAAINVFDINAPKHTNTGQGLVPRLVTQLRGHDAPADQLELSPDKRLLLSCGNDNKVIVWDVTNKKKLTSLKTDNPLRPIEERFIDNKRILTVSQNDIIYLWSLASASLLYNTHRLYRFSPFNYMAWGLDQQNYVHSPYAPKTTGLWKATIDYVLNMPYTNPYPDDQSYTDSLVVADKDISRMYAELTKKEDSSARPGSLNRALLDKYYYRYLLTVKDVLTNKHTNYADRDPVLMAKLQIPDWEIFLLDTLNPQTQTELRYNFSSGAEVYLTATSNYNSAGIYLKFYTDSIFTLFSTAAPSNIVVRSIRNELSIAWFKYYLYTGQLDSAHEMALRLSVALPDPRLGMDVHDPLIAYYLVAGKIEMAQRLYIPTKHDALHIDYLQELLRDIRSKKIAENPITTFLGSHDIDPDHPVGP
jgi:hypothetical protein